MTVSRAARRPVPGVPARRRVPGLALGLAVSLGLTACTGALRQDVDRHDAGIAELRSQVAELRESLQGLRDEVAGLRAALEGGLTGAAAREAEDRRAREAQEALTGRLAAAERRAEDLADGVAGLEVAVATLAEQFARLEAGSAGAATLRRSGSPGTRQAGPPISAEELFDRGMESFRAGELGQAVLDFGEFAEKHADAPAGGERPLLDRRGLLPEPRLRARRRPVPEGDRPRPDRGADPRRPPAPRARAPLAPTRGSGARGLGSARAGLPGQRGGAAGPRGAPPAGPRGRARRSLDSRRSRSNPAAETVDFQPEPPHEGGSVFLTLLRRGVYHGACFAHV